MAYNLVEQDNVTCFDVDDTLAIWPKDFRNNQPGRTEFSYGDEKVYLEEHSYHTVFLKHCFNRGDLVVVWSANGFGWAEQVVSKFGLENHVSIVMTKPTRHVDDKDGISSIVGSRVFIPHNTYEKKND